VEGRERKGKEKELTSPFSFIFSSSLYGAYHFARRVLPLLDSIHQHSSLAPEQA
jgi:hypothetical protein